MDITDEMANFEPQHLIVERWTVRTYSHHGVLIAPNLVVENTAPVLRPDQWRVRITSLAGFSKGRRPVEVLHDVQLTAEAVRHRALGAIGRCSYGLTSRNCEHFTTWCFTGRCQSAQVDRLNDTIGRVNDAVGRGLRTIQKLGDAKWQERWDAEHECQQCGQRHGWSIDGAVTTA